MKQSGQFERENKVPYYHPISKKCPTNYNYEINWSH